MEAAPRDVPPGGSGGEPSTVRPGPTLVIGLVAGLVAGVLGWLGGEVFHDFFPPVTRSVVVMGGAATATADGAAVANASTKNAVVAFGLAGASLGLCLGLAGGLARSSRRQALRAGGAGLALGGIAGAAAAQVLVPVFWAFWYGPKDGRFDPDGMLFPMLVNAGVWSVLGAAGGFAFAVGSAQAPSVWIRTILVGAVGAVAGAVVFEVASALLFATVKLMHPIPPTSPSRLMARLLLALFVAAAVALGSVPRRAPRAVAN